MPSAGRFGSAACNALPQSSYVCFQCRLRASTAVRPTNPSISLPYVFRRQASWLDTTKLRKRIWGSETPPGREDPYGKESVFDRKRRERQQKKEEGRELRSVPEGEVETVPEGEEEYSEGGIGYVPATTAHGLERVGGPNWGATEWEAENSFQGFMESEKIEDRKEIDLAVRRALVETYALKEAGLPLVMDYYSLDPTEDYAKRVAEGARFETDENGQVALVLESEELRQSILDCVTPREGDGVAVEKAGIEEEETSEEEEETLEEEEITSEEEEESRGAEERPPKLVRGDDGTIGEFEGAKQLALEAEPLTPKRSSSDLVTPRESDDAAMERAEIEEKETSGKKEETSEEEEGFRENEERQPKLVEGDDGIIWESEDAEQLALEEEHLDAARSSSELVALVPASDTWHKVSLEDAAIKFAVLKRVMQLTGRRIPDPDISAITTSGSLAVSLGKEPKPKRIAETLVQSKEVVRLPNVQILPRRYGLIEREMEVGRWKVIQEELEKRGLPVTGRAIVR